MENRNDLLLIEQDKQDSTSSVKKPVEIKSKKQSIVVTRRTSDVSEPILLVPKT